MFLGQYRYENSLVYNGVKNFFIGSSDWHGAELRLLSTAITDHKLMIGVEYQNNTSIKQTFQNLDNTDENVAVKSSVLRMGVYLQDAWRITDTLLATL